MNPREEAASYAGWAVARATLVQQRERGHIIAGLLPTTRPLGVSALCVQCGAELQVLFDQGRSLGSPRITGRMGERVCGPGTWWEASDRDERLAPLAFLARAQPGFVGHALAAYRRTQGTALESGHAMAAWLQTTAGALQRLELYPLPHAGVPRPNRRFFALPVETRM